MKNIPKKLLNIKTEWKLHQKMHILKGSGSNSPGTKILGQIWFCWSVLLDMTHLEEYSILKTINIDNTKQYRLKRISLIVVIWMKGNGSKLLQGAQ